MKTQLSHFRHFTWAHLVAVLLSGAAFAQGAVIEAVPQLTNYTLTVSIVGTGTGTVSRSPSATTYASGTVVTLTATPAAGSGFDSWSGAAAGTNKSVKVTITSNTVVTAIFTAYTLRVIPAGTGTGTVSKTPSAATYASGTVVTLTATPAAGSGFDSWSGGATGTNKIVKVTITSNTAVTATFTAYTLTVTKAGTGTGTVSITPSNRTYASGTVVTLTATPAVGSGFASWAGDATGTNKIVKITIVANTAVTANFADKQLPTVKIVAPTVGQKIITNLPFTVSGTAADNMGVASVWVQVNSAGWTQAVGTTSWSLPMQLTPGPNTVQACSQDAAGNTSLIARVVCTNFVMGMLTVQTNGQGSVAATGVPQVGLPYTLTATPAAGWGFVSWTDSMDGLLATNRTWTFSMPSNLMVTANFRSAASLSADGVSALSKFFNDAEAQALDPTLLASALTNFGLAVGIDPGNYTNRICNAMALLLNVINNPALRSQAEAYGVNLDNLLAPTCNFPSSGAPSIDASIDVFAASVLPVMNQITNLLSVPATWTGTVEFSPTDFPALQESVWMDAGDVTALKAACEWFKAYIELLQAYNLNLDIYHLRDPVLSVSRTISIDGNKADWSGVPVSLVDYHGAVTQKMYLATDGGRIALLVDSTIPYANTDLSFSFYFRLSVIDNPFSDDSREVGIYVSGSGGKVTGMDIASTDEDIDLSLSSDELATDAAVSGGVLEIEIPLLDGIDATSQLTLANVGMSANNGSDFWYYSSVKEPSDVPLSVLRANNTEFLSSVRNSGSLAGAKTDLQGAVADYLKADTLIGNRSVTNAALLHLINIDDEKDSRSAFRTLATGIQTSLAGGALNLNVDPDIETSGTEAVVLAKLFQTPSITTNKLPLGLTGTLQHPSWTTFPDPTFNGILPNLTNAKLDKFLRWDSLPLVAPATLSGRIVDVSDDKGDGWQMYFGASTFVQSGDWYGSSPAQVGSYTYTKTGTTTGRMVLTVTAPPACVGSSAITCTFTSNNHHNGTWADADGHSGSFSTEIQNNVAPTTIAGMNVQVDSPTGPGQLVFNSNGTWMQIGMGGMEDWGTYTYAKDAPAGAMLVSKDRDSTHYTMLTFDGTDVLTFNQNSGEMYISNADSSELGQGYFQGVTNMTVTSSGFSNGGTIPATYAYTNANVSPPLAWKAVPPGTQSFALLADDLDANSSLWLVYNLPATTTNLTQNQGLFATLANGAIQGINDNGDSYYDGPNPPSGEKHHYAFMVLALDTMLDDSMFFDPANVHQNDLENAMDGHVLGFGVLTGTYTGSAMPKARRLGVLTGK